MVGDSDLLLQAQGFNPVTNSFGQNVGYVKPPQLDAGQLEQKRQFDVTMAAREKALQGIMSAIGSTSSGGAVPSASVGGGNTSSASTAVAPAPYQPYQSAATTAAYARAKDNTGLALQSALKGLQNTMAARGISGSGIEGGETTKLYESGLTNLANTDATAAGKEADQAFTANQQGNVLGEQAREFNTGQGTNVSEFNAGLIADAQKQRLSSILQAYGSLY